MYRVLLLEEEQEDSSDLARAIEGEGLSYHPALDLNRDINGHIDEALDAVVLDMSSLAPSQLQDLLSQCRGLGLPVVGILPAGKMEEWDPSLNNIDDFAVQPLHPGELQLRIQRAIFKLKGPPSQKVIRVRDLIIDRERYEVALAGRRVLLTYKEYQLLLLLASTPGRVYDREALLNQVWGYDYFGGTRTVDVHIRRLRSKIEDATHSFIETIRNVGYRFKA